MTLGKFFLLAAALTSASISADQILMVDPARQLIAVGLSDPKSVQIDDPVCIEYNDIKIACGEVFQVAGKGVIIYITRGEVNIPKQAEIRVTRELAVPISRNISLGINYRFPQVAFQQLFAEGWAYGILCEALIISKGAERLKGVASLMTMNYYVGGTFSGLWLSLGAGLHIVNIQPTEVESTRDGITSLITQATLGWRLRFSNSINMAVAVGGMYFLDPLIHPYTTTSGLLPSVMVELGHTF